MNTATLSGSRDLAALTAQITQQRRGSAPRGYARLAALLEQLGRPQDRFTAVRVVGTNGKTTVSKMVAAIVDAHGIAVGDTTSPHVTHLNERVCIGGTPIHDALLAQMLTRVVDATTQLPASLRDTVTFFDTMLATAMVTMQHEQVRIGVIEAGIGGVGDASHACDARVIALTPIGHDHPQLGATLTDIATEKAAAVRNGGTLVVGRQTLEVRRAVAAVARERHATVLEFGRHFAVVARRRTNDGQDVDVSLPSGRTARITLRHGAAVFADNAAHALAVADCVLESLDTALSRDAFAALGVVGRSEMISRVGWPDVVLDGAHDGMALAALADELLAVGRRPTTAIVGMTGAHRQPQWFAPILAVVDRVVSAAPDTAGAWSPEKLAQSLVHATVAAAPSPQAAWRWARATTPASGLIVVAGSLHLVGAVRRLLVEQGKALP